VRGGLTHRGTLDTFRVSLFQIFVWDMYLHLACAGAICNRGFLKYGLWITRNGESNATIAVKWLSILTTIDIRCSKSTDFSTPTLMPLLVVFGENGGVAETHVVRCHTSKWRTRRVTQNAIIVGDLLDWYHRFQIAQTRNFAQSCDLNALGPKIDFFNIGPIHMKTTSLDAPWRVRISDISFEFFGPGLATGKKFYRGRHINPKLSVFPQPKRLRLKVRYTKLTRTLGSTHHKISLTWLM